MLEVDVDRIEAGARRDQADIGRAHLIDRHAQHQLVRLQLRLGEVLANFPHHFVSLCRASVAAPPQATALVSLRNVRSLGGTGWPGNSDGQLWLAVSPT